MGILICTPIKQVFVNKYQHLWPVEKCSFNRCPAEKDICIIISVSKQFSYTIPFITADYQAAWKPVYILINWLLSEAS